MASSAMSEASMHPPGRPASMAVAATFTAEPLEPFLRYWGERLELALAPCFAPYHQVFQQLLDPASLAGANAGGVNLLLIRLSDFARDQGATATAGGLRAPLELVRDELIRALAAYARRAVAPLVVMLPPTAPSAGGPEVDALLAELTVELARELDAMPGVTLLREEAWERYEPATCFDPEQDALAHVPYTTAFFAALATALVRAVHALRVPAHKVIVLDCDNTLWAGVVGEDGPRGLRLTPGHERLQRWAVDQQASGAMLCLCSKNEEQDVLRAFSEREDFPLRLEHVVARRINWLPKPANLAALARELNVGVDSFVFLDDNPVECAQMESSLPQVLTLRVPRSREIPGFLDGLWALDRLRVTEEDRRRTEMMRQSAARQRAESAAPTLEAFLASLELVVDSGAPAEEEWGRLAQLTERTNQFNASTVRRTEAELRALPGQGAVVLRQRVRDRFGDYGTVGLLVLIPEADAIRVETFLLSCRVLGRGVEHALLQQATREARARGLSSVRVRFVPSQRNEPMRAFLASLPGSERSETGAAVDYRWPAAVLEQVHHSPGQDPQAVLDAARGAEKPRTAEPARPGGTTKSFRYGRIASGPRLASAIVAEVRAEARVQRPPALPAIAPASAEERTLLALWREVLGQEELGVEDDFFAFGGTSLLAVRLVAELERRTGHKLPLTSVMAAGTVRKMALVLCGPAPEPRSSLVLLRPGEARGPALFLVHDGDGETLLYRNLAKRCPRGLPVYGIPPRSAMGVPLAHTTIAGLARHYVEAIRAVQPSGPYFLGGMCAGGTIAVEVARQLERAGAEVGHVFILDAAAPGAERARGLVSRRRWARFASLFGKGGGSPRPSLGAALATAAGRLGRMVRFELGSRAKAAADRVLFRLLAALLARGIGWPRILPAWNVRRIYDLALAHYSPGPLERTPVLLVRATGGEGGDEAHRHLFADADLGWRSLVRGPFLSVDVAGGHSSMLQEPIVEDLAAKLDPLLRGAGPRPSAS